MKYYHVLSGASPEELPLLTKDNILDDDVFILCDDDCVVSEELIEKANTDDTGAAPYVKVPVYEYGFLSKFMNLLFTIGSGKKIPGTNGIVITNGAAVKKIYSPKIKNTTKYILVASEADLNISTVEAENKKATSAREFFSRFRAIVKSSQTIRFALSSLLAFLIDYTITLVLEALLKDVVPDFNKEIAFVSAWIVSSLVNFTVNREFVFHSTKKLSVALGEYYGVAIVIFLLKNFAMVELLTRVLGVPLAVAKPIAETTFFIVNFFIQKKLVFKKHKNIRKRKTAE